MIKIGFTGDFCPWGRMEDEFKKGDWKKLFASVHSFFQENDLNILDLECPLTTAQKGISKTGPHLKSHPGTAEIIHYLNCALVATANNHFKDYGKQGIQETYDSLKKYQIDWVGSGMNYKEASGTIIRQLKGLKFAFINIAENEWSTTSNDEPGCHPLDTVEVFNRIREVKNEVNYTIVIAHGGHEHYNLPSPRMKKWYRFFVDAGANAVIGHHTHIISGHEMYKDAPIFYSLGNFCFDYEGMRNGTWNKGMLVRLIFKKDEPISYETRFVRQNDQEPGVSWLADKETQEMKENIDQLNTIIADDTLLQHEFDKYANNLKNVMKARIQPYRGRIWPSLYKRGFLPTFIGGSKQQLLSVLIRCESHRDVLLNALHKQNFEKINK